MDVKNALTGTQSKNKAQLIVDYIIEHPQAIDELMECFFHKEYRICQHAAWPLGMLGSRAPQLLKPYLKRMLSNLDHPHHDAVIRNTVRTLQFIEIPEELEGEVYEKCFNYLISPQKPAAIRVFSMTVLGNIAMKIPELKEELILAIEEFLPHGSAGFQNRGKKILKKLRS